MFKVNWVSSWLWIPEGQSQFLSETMSSLIYTLISSLLHRRNRFVCDPRFDLLRLTSQASGLTAKPSQEQASGATCPEKLSKKVEKKHRKRVWDVRNHCRSMTLTFPSGSPSLGVARMLQIHAQKASDSCTETSHCSDKPSQFARD